MRPLIGIPCHSGPNVNASSAPIFYNNRAYVQAIEKAGGVPILVPILDDLEGLETLLPRLDGILLSGGIDIHPHLYRQEPHPLLGETNPGLDVLEMALANWAYEQDIPTLGICRGMQMLNVSRGGTLYQDLSEYPHGHMGHANWNLPRNRISHTVRLDAGSVAEKVLGARELPANSMHHQAAHEPGEGVKITGWADDGVVEVIEVPDRRFMIGAQCHPEELYVEQVGWSRLFQAFVEASAQNRGQIKAPLRMASA